MKISVVKGFLRPRHISQRCRYTVCTSLYMCICMSNSTLESLYVRHNVCGSRVSFVYRAASRFLPSSSPSAILFIPVIDCPDSSRSVISLGFFHLSYLVASLFLSFACCVFCYSTKCSLLKTRFLHRNSATCTALCSTGSLSDLCLASQRIKNCNTYRNGYRRSL